MQRKGQGLIGFVLIEMIFVIFWAIFLGHMISMIGDGAIAAGATGIEAFLWSNLNLFIFLFLVLVNLLVFSFGGAQQ